MNLFLGNGSRMIRVVGSCKVDLPRTSCKERDVIPCKMTAAQVGFYVLDRGLQAVCEYEVAAAILQVLS